MDKHLRLVVSLLNVRDTDVKQQRMCLNETQRLLTPKSIRVMDDILNILQ